MAAKDKLKPSNRNYQPGMQINPPPVRLRMPEIKIPDINIGEVKMSPDAMQPVAEAISQLSRAMQDIARQQLAILQALQQLATKDATVNVQPPAVTVQAPKRAGSYDVEVNKGDGEPVTMRVVPRR